MRRPRGEVVRLVAIRPESYLPYVWLDQADDIRNWPGIGDINPLPPHLVLTKSTTDLHFHIVGPLATSNEVQLSLALNAFNDAVSLLLRGQVEKRSVLEGLDMVLLAADETIDDG
jgi:hypothetical protein